MAALDNESQHLCCLVLECLAHLFSWIPLSNSITPTLLASIFHFARFGCDLRTKAKSGSFISSTSSSSNGHLDAGTMPPSSNGGGRQSEGSKVDRSRLGVLAMTCINELVSKNCVPMDFEEYLLRMFQQTFFLLQRLTRENNAHTVKSRLQDLDERFVLEHLDKNTYFCLFLYSQCNWVECHDNVTQQLVFSGASSMNRPTHFHVNLNCRPFSESSSRLVISCVKHLLWILPFPSLLENRRLCGKSTSNRRKCPLTSSQNVKIKLAGIGYSPFYYFFYF